MTYAEKLASVYPEYTLERLIWDARCPRDFGFPNGDYLRCSDASDENCLRCWSQEFAPTSRFPDWELVFHNCGEDWNYFEFHCPACHAVRRCGPVIGCPKCGAEIIPRSHG